MNSCKEQEHDFETTEINWNEMDESAYNLNKCTICGYEIEEYCEECTEEFLNTIKEGMKE